MADRLRLIILRLYKKRKKIEKPSLIKNITLCIRFSKRFRIFVPKEITQYHVGICENIAERSIFPAIWSHSPLTITYVRYSRTGLEFFWIGSGFIVRSLFELESGLRKIGLQIIQNFMSDPGLLCI
jgi:hypothetical protein